MREKIAANSAYGAGIRQLFFRESLKIPARTDFVFEPNAFDLKKDRMMAIAYQHLEQRSREIGLI